LIVPQFIHFDRLSANFNALNFLARWREGDGKLVGVCGCIALAVMLCGKAEAQDKTPQRGFTPHGSYVLTDIETINTSNGNMMLRIPLASLPPTRGGMTQAIQMKLSLLDG
jgi:hypothetical protein